MTIEQLIDALEDKQAACLNQYGKSTDPVNKVILFSMAQCYLEAIGMAKKVSAP